MKTELQNRVGIRSRVTRALRKLVIVEFSNISEGWAVPVLSLDPYGNRVGQEKNM